MRRPVTGPQLICLLLLAVAFPAFTGGRSVTGDVIASGFGDIPVYTARTAAGTGADSNNGSRGSAADRNLAQPFGVDIGPDGCLYITEVGHHRVWRLNRVDDTMTVVAGNGQKGYSGDGGSATAAAMNEPYEVRFDAAGNLFVVEMMNHIVRRIDRKSGNITTIAGTGTSGFSGDGGPATAATLASPHGIVFDSAGRLDIADIGNHRIRQVDLNSGLITTLAGDGRVVPPTDGGPISGSPLPGPRALAVTGDSLWVALREGHALWRIDLVAGTLHHVAGAGQPGFTGDGGPAKSATFNGPKGLAADAAGNLFIVDSENDAVRRYDLSRQVITTIGGHGRSGRFDGDGGPAAKASFSQPHGICVAADGTVFVADTLNHRVRSLHQSAERFSSIVP